MPWSGTPPAPVEPAHVRRPTAARFVRLWFYKRDVRVSAQTGTQSPPPPPGERDELWDFSRDSQKRLVWVVNNTEARFQSLLTLTYPETWPTCGEEAAEHRRMMLQAINREYGQPLNLWTREFQVQRPAPHNHILLTCPIKGTLWNPNGVNGVPDPKVFSSREQHAWASETWQRLIGRYGSAKGLAAGVRWESLKSARGGPAYLASYFGKSEQKVVPPGFTKPGRWWGHSRAVGKIDPTHSVLVPIEEYLAMTPGKLANPAGWMFGTLHDGRRRAAHWLADAEGGVDGIGIDPKKNQARLKLNRA